MKLDLLVVGDTEAGWSAAIAGQRMGAEVGIVVPLAQKPLHDLRGLSDDLLLEFVRDIHGWKSALRGGSWTRSWDELRSDLWSLVRAEREARRRRFQQLGGTLLTGGVKFLSRDKLLLSTADGLQQILRPRGIVLATGTVPELPWFAVGLPRSQSRLAAEVLETPVATGSHLIVGASLTGLRAACLLALYGNVRLVDGSVGRYGPSAEQPWRDLAGQLGVRFETGASAMGVRVSGKHAQCLLESGRLLSANRLWWATQRRGNTQELQLAAAQLATDDHQRLWCSADQLTWAARIWAAGSVVGYSPVSRSEAEAGQVATLQALGVYLPESVAV